MAEFLDYITNEQYQFFISTPPSLTREKPESIKYLTDEDLKTETIPLLAYQKKIPQLNLDNPLTYKLYLKNNPHISVEEKEHYENLIQELIMEEKKEFEDAIYRINIKNERIQRSTNDIVEQSIREVQ